MERRHRLPPGWEGTVPCRHCGESVHLDSRRIAPAGDSWLMECPVCGREFTVRYGDRDLPQAHAGESPEPEPEPVKRFAWLRRKAASTD